MICLRDIMLWPLHNSNLIPSFNRTSSHKSNRKCNNRFLNSNNPTRISSISILCLSNRCSSWETSLDSLLIITLILLEYWLIVKYQHKTWIWIICSKERAEIILRMLWWIKPLSRFPKPLSTQQINWITSLIKTRNNNRTP